MTPRPPDDSARWLALTLRSHSVAAGALALLLAVGTLGFRIIEGWPWWDSLYMVIISVTTTGYGEVHPLSRAGQVWAAAVLLGGVGVGSYVLLTVSRTFIEGVFEGSLRKALARRRMERELPHLRGHVLVCGYGRLGREIGLSLLAEGRVVVVVEEDPAHVAQAVADGLYAVPGDAADETVLKGAGIERASSLAVATASDAVNTYIVLTARELNPELTIIARANEEPAQRRLQAAGADRVVAPTRIGGQRIAHMLLRPGVVDFLDMAGLGAFPEIFIEEIVMADGAPLASRTIREADYNATWKVLVLAVRRADGTRIFRPGAEVRIDAGDAVILAGHRDDLPRVGAAMHPG